MRVTRRPAGFSLALALFVPLTLALAGCQGASAQAGVRPVEAPATTPAPVPTPTPSPTSPPTPKPAKTTPRPKPATTTAKPAPIGVEVWRLAPGGTAMVGTGVKLYRYRVEVEQATGLNAATVAAMVDATLGNTERGWVRGGFSFQRTDDPGATVEMVIRVAIPSTVDKICGQAHIDTGGVVSCRTGRYVMINLDRWNVGIKAYADVNQYRHLVINHEVGHRLGFGHKTCADTGLPEAPVMMTQYYGLNGCTTNVWPYRADGTFLN